ncbi:MAG TPA: DNA translocase FtsK, partial [Nitrospirae bacterium]|nr:DNA translocase FtsK [Nitrospirota bacterium]
MDKIKRIRYEISGILAVVSGLIVFISLVTHYQWDPSPATTATDARNLLGIFGSYVSDILLQAVGFTAYLFPILLCVFGIRQILGKQGKHKPAAAVAVLLILVVSVSSLFTLVLKDPSGGILGSVSTRISLKLLSTTGSYLLFVPLAFVTIMFLTPFSITDFAREIRKKAVMPRMPVPFKNKKKKKEQPHIEESEPVQAAPYKQKPLPLVYPAEIKQRTARKAKGEYEIPSIELLRDPQPAKSKPSKDELLASSELLAKKLKDFSVDGSVTHVTPGPVVTMFEFEPAPGVKINRILSLADDLALPLKTTSLRIAPIPGKSTLGIEVPNRERETVYLKEMLASEAFRKSSSKLTLALGKDIF